MIKGSRVLRFSEILKCNKIKTADLLGGKRRRLFFSAPKKVLSGEDIWGTWSSSSAQSTLSAIVVDQLPGRLTILLSNESSSV